MYTCTLEQSFSPILRFFDSLFDTDAEKEEQEATAKIAKDIKDLVKKDVDEELEEHRTDEVTPGA